MSTRLLVIGYGNELRGDDGVGPHVARVVAAWGLPNVTALAVQQLVPELAEPLSRCDAAVFVDAGLLSGEEIAVRELPAAPPHPTLSPAEGEGGVRGAATGHGSDPAGLLALCQLVYGRAPRAWLVAVPAENLEFGDRLTAKGKEGASQALQWVRGLAAGRDGLANPRDSESRRGSA